MCYRWDENKNKYEINNLKPNPNIKVKSYLKNLNLFLVELAAFNYEDYQLFGSAILDAKKGREIL